MQQELKLFVWNGFAPDCTPGLAFAIAKGEKAARRLVIKDYRCEPTDWGSLEVLSLNKPVARAVSGGE